MFQFKVAKFQRSEKELCEDYSDRNSGKVCKKIESDLWEECDFNIFGPMLIYSGKYVKIQNCKSFKNLCNFLFLRVSDIKI